MAPEFWIKREKQDGVYDSDGVGKDVQNIHCVLEVKFLAAVAEILNKPHNLVR